MSLIDFLFSLIEEKKSEMYKQQDQCSHYSDKRLFQEVKSGSVTKRAAAAQELKQRGYGQKKK